MADNRGIRGNNGLAVLLEALVIKVGREDGTHRQENDLNILKDGIILDVKQVITQLVLSGGVVVACNLRKARNTGLNRKPLGVARDLLFEGGDELGALGSRADYAHLAHENVHELRQLVDLGAAQEPSDLGDTGVVLAGDDGACDALGVYSHGAQLVDLIRLVVDGKSRLLEEYGASVLGLDEDGADEEDRRREHECKDGDEQVEDPLEQSLLEGETHSVHEHYHEVIQVDDPGLVKRDLVELRYDVNYRVVLGAGQDDVGFNILGDVRAQEDLHVTSDNRTHRTLVGVADEAGEVEVHAVKGRGDLGLDLVHGGHVGADDYEGTGLEDAAADSHTDHLPHEDVDH